MLGVATVLADVAAVAIARVVVAAGAPLVVAALVVAGGVVLAAAVVAAAVGTAVGVPPQAVSINTSMMPATLAAHRRICRCLTCSSSRPLVTRPLCQAKAFLADNRCKSSHLLVPNRCSGALIQVALQILWEDGGRTLWRFHHTACARSLDGLSTPGGRYSGLASRPRLVANSRYSCGTAPDFHRTSPACW